MSSQATITIDPTIRKLIPPLTQDEFEGLTASLIAEGCRDSLVVWDGILLDGHNRYDICTANKIAYKTVTVNLANKEEAELWVLMNARNRRNLTEDQRAVIEEEIRIRVSAIVKRSRAGKAGKAGGISRPKNSLSHDVCDKLSQPKRDTRKEAAKRAGVSRRKMEQAAFVKKEAPILFAEVKEGAISLAAAVRDTKKKKQIEALEDIKTKEVKLLDGKFDVLVIDPPWPIKKIERDERPNQSEIDYPTMTVEEIGTYFTDKIHHADDCHVWLWTTHKFFPDAVNLFATWSVKYVCTFVWHKPGGFQPIGLPQYNCEFCLYGRIGNPSFIDTKAFFTCFNADRGKHSEKPDCFYETVVRVTAGLRGAPFERKSRAGFEVGGNEV